MFLTYQKHQKPLFSSINNNHNWFTMTFIKEVHGDGNIINYELGKIKKLSININGDKNNIFFDHGAKINNLIISISGSNNKVKIGAMCSIVGVVHIKGDGNSLYIDRLTSFQNTNINIQEGTSVHIGENCMFASGVQIRTSDSHSITDMDGNRINQAKNIVIGNKCWLGLDVLVMKGSMLPNETIVGARSTVIGYYEKANTIIAGTPAKIIKEGVRWSRKLI